MNADHVLTRARMSFATKNTKGQLKLLQADLITGALTTALYAQFGCTFDGRNDTLALRNKFWPLVGIWIGVFFAKNSFFVFW
jgi:hypothetical protein